MKAVLFLNSEIDVKKYIDDDTYLIGVDRGALLLAMQGINMDLAVGDFDSVEYDTVPLIEKMSKKLIKLNPVKDDTDTAHALMEAYKLTEDVTIIGGIQGKRIEHLISNICDIVKYKTLKIMDDNSIIYMLDKDSEFTPDEYKFISFYALEDSVISLDGFKYNLNNYNMKLFDSLGVSNEITSETAKITISSGKILVIKSKSD